MHISAGKIKTALLPFWGGEAAALPYIDDKERFFRSDERRKKWVERIHFSIQEISVSWLI